MNGPDHFFLVCWDSIIDAAHRLLQQDSRKDLPPVQHERAILHDFGRSLSSIIAQMDRVSAMYEFIPIRIIVLLVFSPFQIQIHMVVRYDGVEDDSHELLQDEEDIDVLFNYQNIS